jgi:hypothetical protein
MARQSLKEISHFVDLGPTVYVSKFIGHSKHALFLKRSNAQSSEKDHDLPGI